MKYKQTALVKLDPAEVSAKLDEIFVDLKKSYDELKKMRKAVQTLYEKKTAWVNTLNRENEERYVRSYINGMSVRFAVGKQMRERMSTINYCHELVNTSRGYLVFWFLELVSAIRSALAQAKSDDQNWAALVNIYGARHLRTTGTPPWLCSYRMNSCLPAS